MSRTSPGMSQLCRLYVALLPCLMSCGCVWADVNPAQYYTSGPPSPSGATQRNASTSSSKLGLTSNATDRTITVMGRGSNSSSPLLALVTLEITKSGVESEPTRSAVLSESEALETALKQVDGIGSKNISRGGLSGGAKKTYYGNGTEHIDGYYFTMKLQLKIWRTSGDSVPNVLKVAKEAGGDDMTITEMQVKLTYQQARDMGAQARYLAAQDAQRAAFLYSKSMGVTLKRLLAVHDDGDKNPQETTTNFQLGASKGPQPNKTGAASEIVVLPQTIDAQVTLEYEFTSPGLR